MDKIKLNSMLLREGARQGVSDPDLLLALARVENGRYNSEMNYGMRGRSRHPRPEWRGMERQVLGAVSQIKILESRFSREIGRDPLDGEGHYTPEFLLYLSHGVKPFDNVEEGYQGYAPLDAPNDPTGLNQNHFYNLSDIYYRSKGRVDLIPKRPQEER